MLTFIIIYIYVLFYIEHFYRDTSWRKRGIYGRLKILNTRSRKKRFEKSVFLPEDTKKVSKNSIFVIKI